MSSLLALELQKGFSQNVYIRKRKLECMKKTDSLTVTDLAGDCSSHYVTVLLSAKKSLKGFSCEISELTTDSIVK